VAIGLARIQLESLPEALLGLGRLALGVECDAELVVRLGVSRVELGAGAQLGFRLAVAFETIEDRAAVEPVAGVFGIGDARPADVFQPFVQLARPAGDGTEDIPRLGDAGILADDLEAKLLCLRELAGEMVSNGAGEQGLNSGAHHAPQVQNGYDTFAFRRMRRFLPQLSRTANSSIRRRPA